jgi:hypothetical protein
MAPEQWKLAKDLDARTDVYALGLVLFECLYGRHPHGAESSLAGWRRVHCEGEPPPVPQLDGLREHRRALIERMLDRDRAKRPASMDQVIVELDREPKRRLPMWLLLALAGLLLAGGVAIVVFALQSKPGAAIQPDAITRDANAPPRDALALDVAVRVLEWCARDATRVLAHIRIEGDSMVLIDKTADETVKYDCDAWTGKTRTCHPIGQPDYVKIVVVEELPDGIRLTDGTLQPSDARDPELVLDKTCAP